MNKVEDQELKRNGEGYLDLTAYHAIKKADRDLENNEKSNTRTRKSSYYNDRKMTLKQYIKRKLKILDELGIELSDDEEQHLRSLKTEIDVDAYAHRLIMTKE